MDAGEEARLVGLARAGDLRAFSLLVDDIQAPVRAFLRRLVGNWADADDLAQEAFARTWEVLDRYDGRARLKSFVCGVAYQYWRRNRRAASRRTQRETAYMEIEQAESESVYDAAHVLALRRAMEDLPVEQRACLALCLGGELSHSEAAEALGMPIGTVKSHVTRGRARLKAALGLKDECDE